ncbi:MAG: metallophosphoesterase [Lachnospiraceae bacterium]|nr:metallophosphoesterase [Lachnospiraceae bacterium]
MNAEKKTVLRFAVMSDVHTGETTDEEALRFERAMNRIYDYAEKQEYPALDALLVAGDQTKRGHESEMAAFKEILDKSIREGTRPLLVMGNHEYFDEAGKHVSDRWVRIMEQSMNTHEVINGYHFIGVSLTSYVGYDDQLEWLENELEKAKADTPDKPIFVQQHYHVGDTVYGSDLWGDACLKPVFDKYPQVIDFSGHSHYPVNDPRSIWQGTFTALGCGTLSYFELEPGMIYGTIPPRATDAFQFYIVEVEEDDTVVVRAYDGITEQFFPFEYRIEAPFVPENFKYTDKRAEKAGKPSFDESATVTVKKVTDSSVTLIIPQASDKDCIHSYRFDFYVDEKIVKSESVWSEFYFMNMPEKLTQEFEELMSQTHYEVKVTAINSWGKECDRPIKTEFTTK